jgi:hypothetical protein
MLLSGVKYSYKATHCWIIYVWLIGHIKLKFYAINKVQFTHKAMCKRECNVNEVHCIRFEISVG